MKNNINQSIIIPQGYLLYKIYYGNMLVYIGRTKQKLTDRIKGHVMAKPMHRKIDIFQISRIEYAEFLSESDMNVYEVYYINLFKPLLNVDDKAKDALHIRMPDAYFKPFMCKEYLDRWKLEIAHKTQNSHITSNY